MFLVEFNWQTKVYEKNGKKYITQAYLTYDPYNMIVFDTYELQPEKRYFVFFKSWKSANIISTSYLLLRDGLVSKDFFDMDPELFQDA